MNVVAKKKTEIIRDLSLIPDNKLDDIKLCIDTILQDSKIPEKSNRSLQGIWKDKGFEQIADLDNEVKEARKELSDSILKKQI